MQNVKEVESKLKELDEQYREYNSKLTEINNEVHKLIRERNCLLQEKLRPLIGTCFVDKKGNYYLVTDVPRRSPQIMSLEPNFYQIPVLKVTIKNPHEERSITYETVYSKAAKAEDPYQAIAEEYKIISAGEFERAALHLVEEIYQEAISNRQNFHPDEWNANWR